MADNKIKALAIKVNSKTEPQGVEYAWDKIPQLEVFTKNIIIPEIAVDKDGNTVIPTKETTVTVTYTNIGTTSTDDTNKTNNQEIAVKIDASGKGTFTVETKDDYYAEADENYNVKITNPEDLSLCQSLAAQLAQRS